MSEKKSAPRIVLIGAGSAEFGLTTLGDLLTAGAETLRGATVVLHDLDESSLDLTTRAFVSAVDAEKQTHGGDPAFRVEKTLDLSTALRGASYVVISIENGNRAKTWQQDYYIPIKHGSRQVYGENGGPGGAFHTWRQVGPLLRIARAMEEWCPDAWLLNFSNPLPRLTWALNRATRIKTVGLCHGIASGLRAIERILGTPTSNLEYTSAGLNHIYWFLDVRAKNEFSMPAVDGIPGRKVSPGDNLLEDIRERGQVVARAEELHFLGELLRLYGHLTYASQSHPAEYIPWSDAYCRSVKYNFQELAVKGARIRERLKRTLEGQEEPSWWLRQSGERAVQIISGIEHDTGQHEDAVNMRNGGTITNLPPDCVVETPATVNAKGITQQHIGELPKPIARLLQKQVIVQEAVVEAALTNDYGTALEALILDDTVPNPTVAKNILDEMLELQRGLLPEFA